MGACGGKRPGQGQSAREDAAKGKGEERDNATLSKSAGYTIEHFVKDNLVPFEGFACRQPHDVKREKDLQREMKDLNERLDAALKAEMMASGSRSGDKMPPADRIRKEAIPLEAICRVRLETVKVQGNAGQMFDLHQSSTLEVRLQGRLLFPPEAHWDPRDRKSRQDSFDHRWQLPVKVWARLERDGTQKQGAISSDPNGSSATALQVKCIQLDVDLHESGGDPMVDSWLPRRDILKDIERLLDDKLQLAVSDMGESDL
mmetsp:Transcript_28037/g.63502  ORF Transcript_28037/g.63502 Transcript_28037/m.63502 type:complete len:259 (-) Transcript_28037:113-889(-)